MIAIDDLRAQWDANFTTWKAAKEPLDEADALHVAAFNEAPDAPETLALAGKCDDLAGPEGKARFDLLLTPAPDFAAVAWKLHTLYGVGDFEGDEYSSAWRREYPLSIMADMARLQSAFAEAWLADWTKDGGSVVIDDEGKAQFGWPAYDLSPCYREPDAKLQEVRDNLFLHAQAHYDATMRARYDALKLVPGGADMVKAHMQALGIRCALRCTEGR